MSETMAKHWMEKYKTSSLENAKLRAALETIAGHKGMTNLGLCCCNKTCQQVFDDDGTVLSSCAFQFGVNRGFDACAYEAEDALKACADKDPTK